MKLLVLIRAAATGCLGVLRADDSTKTRNRGNRRGMFVGGGGLGFRWSDSG